MLVVPDEFRECRYNLERLSAGESFLVAHRCNGWGSRQVGRRLIICQHQGLFVLQDFCNRSLPAIRSIIQQIVASGLIYLPSSSLDFKEPRSRPVSRALCAWIERRRLQRAHQDHEGPMGRHWLRFGGRHELYELNYAGNHEAIRIQALMQAKGSGALAEMQGLAASCLADYDENGWTDSCVSRQRGYLDSRRLQSDSMDIDRAAIRRIRPAIFVIVGKTARGETLHFRERSRAFRLHQCLYANRLVVSA